MTRAVIALAQADQSFARGLMTALLQSTTRGRELDLASKLSGKVHCYGERSLFNQRGTNLGRVDIVLEQTDMTLFVEVKLHSDYGVHQLDRYMRGIRPERGDYLIAVTRNISRFIEPPTGTPGWLGSIRWAHIVRTLRRITATDSVARQWNLLLDVLEEDGDMGSTKLSRRVSAYEGADSAWERLTDFLEQIGTAALPLLRTELCNGGTPRKSAAGFAKARQRRPPKAAKAKGQVDPDKPEVISQDDQLYLGFKIPRSGPERLWIGFYIDEGIAWFYIAASSRVEKPTASERERWNRASESLRPRLRGKRFYCNDDDDLYVQVDYRLSDFSKSSDVPRDLAARAEEHLEGVRLTV